MAGLGALFAGSSMLIIVLVIVGVIVLPIVLCVGCCVWSGMLGAGAIADLDEQLEASRTEARSVIEAEGLTNVVVQSSDVRFIGIDDEMVIEVTGYGTGDSGDTVRWDVLYTRDGNLIGWKIDGETYFSKMGYQNRVEDSLGW